MSADNNHPLAPGNKNSLNSRPSTGSLRNAHPPSPRTRHPSISQFFMADLLSSPPPPKYEGPPRDWQTVRAGELLDEGETLRFVDLETPVETACQVLIDHNLSTIPIRTSPDSESACGTFDYSDLTAFLLLIMGLYQPEEDEDMSSFEELARKARAGSAIPVKLVKDLGKKDPFITVGENEALSKVVETLGSGVHMVAVVREGTNKVIGMLDQGRLVRFFWENGRCFTNIEGLYPCSLRDIGIGSSNVISISGDRKVLDALELMNTEGISSLAVVDSQHNVIGNISTEDVKYLTRSSSMPLLRSTCLHFLSVILTDRGLSDGKDPYPVFYVTAQSTLAHTVAKLVATRAHRMWVVDTPSPSSSTPPTPSLPPQSANSSSASSSSFPVPGASMSGRLTGVVSLTDILNLFARSSGLAPTDPMETRRQRRRSSSSSIRASFDQTRSTRSFEIKR
ncbi:cell separation during budding [Rhizina undulata]